MKLKTFLKGLKELFKRMEFTSFVHTPVNVMIQSEHDIKRIAKGLMEAEPFEIIEKKASRDL